ncbi:MULTISPECIES: oligopeptide/dipeptide ABC transporter ATP-binding protein [unclassified Mesorhizobium]|uniref:ABC transporter ATP-binding protein n=1 Tax=unclassified Mesorhizobium TaxID=325217 RepID=UPI0003CECD7A|nr:MULTISPECIES: oligopeptide/dipeptide ABC transporter ATP-binding protein [unclassified Mesorhizobium]ESX27455.1 peptide ABC transporter substrate-binding protein [Mesorhizobium sp. LSHC440B00]ESX35948.1 peptide ABC transporter substrate-binding protein [Mesorhizobium sp. LSHC432A00]ESX41289.1 peptide ABC transporter substrate-binding protein [Mesorhizobium sp. LSHC440A00]WJI55590.1 ATP-binding cassette domain-containing protein [Mesorhizobium sp. C432A]
MAVLEVENLVTSYPSAMRGKTIKAVNDVSITLNAGEIVGLVGESGCGKSTLGRSIVGLEKPQSGRVIFDGVDLGSLSGGRLREVRRAVQYVFQDPYASLNDRQTVGEAIAEALIIKGMRSKEQRAARTTELLDQVGLATQVRDRFTRELSGGQRQRVAIARSLAVEPRVLICDEPVSALDLSIRAQVMNLFMGLRRDLGVACLFIAHDLGLVRQASSRVYVMYLGRIVEMGTSEDVYNHPSHPYTQLLLASVPAADPIEERNRKVPLLVGEIPSPTNPPSGCAFRTRCPLAVADCATALPPQIEVSAGHRAACVLAEKVFRGERSALDVPPESGRMPGQVRLMTAAAL